MKGIRMADEGCFFDRIDEVKLVVEELQLDIDNENYPKDLKKSFTRRLQLYKDRLKVLEARESK
jgi:hypothetical protein